MDLKKTVFTTTTVPMSRSIFNIQYHFKYWNHFCIRFLYSECSVKHRVMKLFHRLRRSNPQVMGASDVASPYALLDWSFYLLGFLNRWKTSGIYYPCYFFQLNESHSIGGVSITTIYWYVLHAVGQERIAWRAYVHVHIGRGGTWAFQFLIFLLR